MSKSILTGVLVALVVALVGVGVYSVFVNAPPRAFRPRLRRAHRRPGWC